MEARSLMGLCDRYFLLTHVLGRSDMLWYGDPGESVPAGNVWLYERCREVEAGRTIGSTSGRATTTSPPSSPMRRHPGDPAGPGDHRRHIQPHPPGRQEVHAADQADVRGPRIPQAALSRGFVGQAAPGRAEMEDEGIIVRRRSLVGARSRASSTARSSGLSRTFTASGIIPILNHESDFRESGY
jgi:hypothetical protein